MSIGRTAKRRVGLVFLGVILVGVFARGDLRAAEPKRLMEWYPPPAGPKMGIFEGLDLNTLAELTRSGVLQYFQPRSEPGRWDVVVGMMIHAPVETVWEIATDYPALCRHLPATFDVCELLAREGSKTRMHYQLHTSVLKFTFHLDIIDEITEVEPYHWKLETVSGHLKGRQLELLLIPRGPGETMAFLRYYGNMRSIGAPIRLTLSLLPDLESPVYASAATYHLRSYKNEAEKRAGYTPPPRPPGLNTSALDPQTLLQLCQWNAGIIQETPEGKTLGATAFAVMAAPQEKVWEVMTDFEHYDEIFPDSHTVVEKHEGNTVVLRQSIRQVDIYIFSYGFDLHARYTLDPPAGFSYVTIDGVYEGTTGRFTLLPIENNTRTFVFAAISVMMERDTSLTMKIVRSGEFPFDSTVNLFFARSVLNGFQAEVKKRNPQGG